jgi:hypothetical protein
LVSNEYVLRRLEKTHPNEVPKLYITPPLHSHAIKHSIVNDTNIEFLHPFDDSFIIRIYQDAKNSVIYVQMFNFNKQKPIDGFKWDLKETKLINGNTINMKSTDPKLKTTKMQYDICISSSGEYICAISEYPDHINYQTLNIKSSDKKGASVFLQQRKKKKFKYDLSNVMTFNFERMMHPDNKNPKM